MANSKLLKEAIADAKAVRETAIANAKIALEEAFTPKLQSMLSKKIEEEAEEVNEEELEEQIIQQIEVLVDELGGKVKSHQKFGTSVVILPDENRIDVATARLEHYDHPGALPKIEQSSIKSDLYRRDFTINSMALNLNGDEAFSLRDFIVESFALTATSSFALLSRNVAILCIVSLYIKYAP